MRNEKLQVVVGSKGQTGKMDKGKENLEENVWEVVPVQGSVQGPKMSSHEAVVHGNSMFLFGKGEMFSFDFVSSSWSKLTIKHVEPPYFSSSSSSSNFKCPLLLTPEEVSRRLKNLEGTRMLFYSFNNPTRNCLLIDGGFFRGHEGSPYTYTFDIDSHIMNQLLVSCAFQKEDFPVARWRHGIGLVPNSHSSNSDKLLIWGGYSSPGPINEMHELDLNTKVWSSVEQLGEIPAQRSSFGFCDFANGNDFYFFVYGGTSPTNENTLYVFHYQTHIWTKLTRYFTVEKVLPQNLRQRMVIVSNQRMTIFGGSEDSKNVYHASLEEILNACEISREEYLNKSRTSEKEKKTEEKNENENKKIVNWHNTSCRPKETAQQNLQQNPKFPSFLATHIMVAYEDSLYLHVSDPTLWKWRCPFLLYSLVHFVKQFMVVNNIAV